MLNVLVKDYREYDERKCHDGGCYAFYELYEAQEDGSYILIEWSTCELMPDPDPRPVSAAAVVAAINDVLAADDPDYWVEFKPAK